MDSPQPYGFDHHMAVKRAPQKALELLASMAAAITLAHLSPLLNFPSSQEQLSSHLSKSSYHTLSSLQAYQSTHQTDSQICQPSELF